MRQYCRYCNNLTCGDANYCCVNDRTYSDSYVRKPNNCKWFELNPIDALMENPNGYRPRGEKRNADDSEQIRIVINEGGVDL